MIKRRNEENGVIEISRNSETSSVASAPLARLSGAAYHQMAAGSMAGENSAWRAARSEPSSVYRRKGMANMLKETGGDRIQHHGVGAKQRSGTTSTAANVGDIA